MLAETIRLFIEIAPIAINVLFWGTIAILFSAGVFCLLDRIMDR